MNKWSLLDQVPVQVKKIFFITIGPLLALVFAYFAQAIFDSTRETGLHNWVWLISQPESSRLWLGVGVYLLAMLIWIFSAPSIQSRGFASDQPDLLNRQKTRNPPIRIFLLVSSISLYVFSVLLFVKSGENSIIRGLWAAGLVFFILSQIPWLGIQPVSHPEAEESPRFQWQNWLMLTFILGVAFWLRFYHLSTIPSDFHGDMASHGLVARDFLLGIKQEIFGFGWTVAPAMGYVPAAFTMAIFGNNIYGLQMAVLIGGMFSLLAIYLLTWRLFDSHRLAALVTSLVAINVPHIHFSRIAEYMNPWPFGYFALFFFIHGLKARRAMSFGLAGVFLGFSFLMYTSGLVLIFIIVIFLVYLFIFHRSWISQNKSGMILMVVGVLITMGPGLVNYLMHWDIFSSRSREVFIFSPGAIDHLLNKYNTNSKFVVLLTQIKLSLLMFNHSNDSSSQFGFPHPMFSSLISPLLLLGLGYALRRWKDANIFFILTWLGLMMVLGSILTLDAPFWPRLVGIIPAAALLIALALDQIIELWKKIFGAHSIIFITALIAIYLVAIGYLNWNQYFLIVKDSASATTVTGRYINSLPLNVTACSILSGPPLNVRETYFLAWPHKLIDIRPDAPDSDLDTCTGSALVWVVSPENLNRLDALRARWPSGITQTYTFPNSNYTMTFYLIGVNHPPKVHDVVYGKKSNLSISGIIIFTSTVVLFGIMIWLILRIASLILSSGRKINSKFHLPAFQFDWKSIRLGFSLDWVMVSLKSIWVEISMSLNNWYDEILAYKFSSISYKILPSTLLPYVALGLAYLAQTFLDQQKGDGLHLHIKWMVLSSEGQLQVTACIIFLVSALLWTFGTPDMENEQLQSQNLKRVVSETSRLNSNNNFWQFVGGRIRIVGIFSTVSAILLYIIQGENNVVRWLWIAGLGLFFVSLLLKSQFAVEKLKEESPPFRWFHVLILSTLLILAFYLRVYRLYDIPLDLSTDMASVGMGARDYLLGKEQSIFGTGWYYMPRLTFIPYIISMAVIGNNLFGLYFATVIMGTFNVLGIYLFIWRLFDRHRLALLTAVLVTINPAHINFSRITSYMDPWFLGFYGLFFFVDGLKGRRKASFAIAGLFTGFVLVSYPSGRVIVPMIGIALACFWMFKRTWVIENYSGLRWMALGVFTALGPNLAYLISDWSVYMQRSKEVIIFNSGVIEHLKYTYNVDSVWMIVWEQVKRSLLLFNYYTDKSAQFAYPHPMFNSLVSPLLILGFGMGLYRWRKPEFLFVISSFLLILVTGSILTDNAPTWVRLVGIIPLAALLIALVIDQLLIIFEQSSVKPLVPFLMIGVFLFIGVLAVDDWDTYLREVENSTRPEVRVARYLNGLPDDINACGITDDYRIDQEEIQFLGWPRSIVVVAPDTVTLTANTCPGQYLVWILSPIYINRLSELKIQWPGGIVEDHRVENGDLVFTSYLISKQSIP